MEQFSKRLSKLVSKQKLTMNQRDYTIVKSVSKQQFENKKRKQKLKYLERKKENVCIFSEKRDFKFCNQKGDIFAGRVLESCI